MQLILECHAFLMIAGNNLDTEANAPIPGQVGKMADDCLIGRIRVVDEGFASTYSHSIHEKMTPPESKLIDNELIMNSYDVMFF
jgi:hypothetical protein